MLISSFSKLFHLQNFLEDKEANKQINQIYALVIQNKSDAEIAEIFNNTNVKNLQTPLEAWDKLKIATLRESFKLDTGSPKIMLTAAENSPEVAPVKKKPSIILIILSIIMVLISLLFSYGRASLEIDMAEDMGRFIGSAFTPLLFPTVMVGLFQMVQGFRNPSSRVKIFFWASLFIFLGTIGNFVSSVSENLAQQDIKEVSYADITAPENQLENTKNDDD